MRRCIVITVMHVFNRHVGMIEMVNYDELMAYAETHGIDKDKLNRVIDSPAVSTYGPDDDLVLEDGYVPASCADAVKVLLGIAAFWNNQ